MASLEVGTMLFNVRANTAKFKADLDGVKSTLTKFDAAGPNSLAGQLKGLRESMGVSWLSKELERAKYTAQNMAAMKPWRPVVEGWAEKFAIDVNRTKQQMGGLQGGGGLLMAGFAGGVGGSVAGMMERLAAQAINVGKSTITMAANMETARASFEVLTGSGQKASQMLEGLRALSAKSGMDFGSLQDGAKTLMAFGVEGDRVIPILRTIGNITGGSADRTQMLTLAFSQMSAAGRLMGQDLLQMVNAGFNPLQQISAKTGESMIQLKKRMEEGGVSAMEVMQAFQDATSEGGRFFGMSEKQAGTFNRQWATLKSQISTLGTDLGQNFLPPLTEGLRLTNSLVKSFNSLRGATAATVDENQKIVTKLDEIAAAEKKRADELEKQTKALDESNKKLRDRAEELTKGLATPIERATEQMQEFQQLLQQGLLTPETFDRATEKLLRDLEKASDLKQKIAAPVPELGAVDVNTTEGQRLQSAFNANISKLEGAAQAEVAEQRRANELIKQLLEETKNKKPVSIKKVSVA